MKLIIFGASGSLGRHLVAGALAQNHQVTAFARRPAALGLEHRNLSYRAGDVLDPNAVADAVRGQDAVLIALGAGRKGTVRSLGTRHIVDAMVRHSVRRLTCLSTLGAGDSYALLNFFWKRMMFGLLLRAAYADHQAQEALVKRSGLDWVIVRPGAFTDGPATGAYRQGVLSAGEKLKLKISRADTADFMLQQLTGNAYLRQSPCLSY